MDQGKLLISASDFIGNIDDSIISVVPRIMKNTNDNDVDVDVKGYEDDAKTGTFVTIKYI